MVGQLNQKQEWRGRTNEPKGFILDCTLLITLGGGGEGGEFRVFIQTRIDLGGGHKMITTL